MASYAPPCDFVDRFVNIGIRATTTNVSAHALANLSLRPLGRRGEIRGRMTRDPGLDFAQHGDGGADLAGRAITTLVAIILDEGGLQRMEVLRLSQPLDSRD